MDNGKSFSFVTDVENNFVRGEGDVGKLVCWDVVSVDKVVHRSETISLRNAILDET